jgi:hypothetical protein
MAWFFCFSGKPFNKRIVENVIDLYTVSFTMLQKSIDYLFTHRIEGSFHKTLEKNTGYWYVNQPRS